MRIILHIGMPKTGSTQVQSTLEKNRSLLLEQGVLYPENPSPLKSHTFLTAAIPLVEQGRMVKSLFETQEQLDYFFDSSAEELRKSIKNLGPDTLVLSSEFLFRPMSDSAMGRIKSVFESIEHTFEVVCYVRNPAEYYLSLTLQQLKQSSIIPKPGPVRYREEIESYIEFFGNVEVLRYDRPALKGGSVDIDFVSRFLCVTPEELASSSFSNVSLSAEGMELIRRFRKELGAELENRPDPASSSYYSHVQAVEQSFGANRKARLRDDVAESVISASEDVLWLRHKFGIIFDGLDYNKVDGSLPEAREIVTLADVCIFDHEYLSSLSGLLKKAIRPTSGAKRRQFLAPLFQFVTSGRGRERRR